MSHQSPLAPSFWRYYNVIVTSIGGLLSVLNALIPITSSERTDMWIGAGISVLTAVLVWLRRRHTELGYTNGEPPTDSSRDEMEGGS